MSVCRKLPDGTIQKIAGHTILLDANASEVREGTVVTPEIAVGGIASVDITFSDPMPDTDYLIMYEFTASGGNRMHTYFRTSGQTTTGCKVWINNPVGADLQASTLKYIAWKPIKLDGYTELQNKVNSPDETPTIDSMNLVTSDGVARAIENASAVWKGTRAEWNALPAADKKKYDLAVLLDKTLVKAVDRETGDEDDVADLTKVFTGTDEEWEALSATDKTTYALSATSDRKRLHSVDRETGDVTEIADLTRIWRGTKEEWDELTDEERDKWDQAEIETIEPKDVNPFRTLSDIEELSITPNTDYICPHDGFISAQGPIGADISTYINGQVYGFDTDDSNTRSVHTVPVCKGDVFKYTLSDGVTSGAVIRARWYTNEVSPGPTDTPVLYRSQALDWDNKVAISNTELQSGWTATGDGFFICRELVVKGQEGSITINGINIGYSNYTNSAASAYQVQIPVAKGDVLAVTRPLYTGWSNSTWFVPYKDYPDYSTEEHWTGRRWIDGKKIYSKVLTVGETKTITTHDACLGITDVMNVMPIERLFRPAIVDWQGGDSMVFYGDVGNYMIGIPAPGTTLKMVTGSHVVIEYTKTTD